MASATRKVNKFVDKAYQNDFMKGIHQLYQKEEYTDVTLQSGDVEIRCHRLVLAVASDYFKPIFKCDLKESTSNTIQLTTESEILKSIVDYIYTGEIELTINNVQSLVKACDILKLDGLKSSCEDFMGAQVDLSNCVGIYKFAALYRLHKVQGEAKRVMLAEFKTVGLSDQFKELSCSELVELIRDDDVSVDEEDIVVESVLDWVRCDLDNRKSSLETILEHVRLPYCTSHYLRHMNVDLLTPRCFKYLHEALSFQADTVLQHEISSCRTVPRSNFRMKSCLLVVGGLICPKGKDDGNEECNRCQYYKEEANCWESLTKMPQSVGRLYNVCHVEGGLLLTGGFKGSALAQCWLYDLARKKWEAMPPLIAARCYHRSVSIGNCVYVVGGMGVSGKVLAAFACLNLKRRQWSSLPDMPQAVHDPAVVTHSNKIFVFGGLDAQNKLLSCTQVFDTRRGSWNTLADMSVVCSRGAAVALNECIYVVGGHSRTCLRYDPETDTWMKLNQPRERHCNAPSVAWRGCILVAGGGGPNPESSVIEQYDPRTDTWSDWKISLDAKRICHYMFNVDLYEV